MLPLAEILAHATPLKPGAITSVTASLPEAPAKTAANKSAEPAEMPKPSEATSQQAADGFLVNGSVNNAATSQFTLAPAFGNTRKGYGALYTGGISLIFGNSALDARPFSVSGLNQPKQSYSTITSVLTFGGPLNIPHLMPRGPNFFIVYEWTGQHRH